MKRVALNLLRQFSVALVLAFVMSVAVPDPLKATAVFPGTSGSEILIRKSCGSGSYVSHLTGSSSQLVHWARTIASGSDCDAEVELWIEGDPHGPNSDQAANIIELPVEWNATEDPFCGTFSGRSNHWMIDSGGWHELISWLLDQKYVWDGCGV